MRITPRRASLGMSLLELTVAIAVLTALAGILGPAILTTKDDAEVARIVSLAENLKKACERYYFDTGYFPIENDINHDPMSTDGQMLPRHDLYVMPAPMQSVWKGPYISAPLSTAMTAKNYSYLTNWLKVGAIPYVFSIGGASYNGDGVALVIQGVKNSVANRVERLLDQYPQTDNWQATGTVVFGQLTRTTPGQMQMEEPSDVSGGGSAGGGSSSAPSVVGGIGGGIRGQIGGGASGGGSTGLPDTSTSDSATGTIAILLLKK